MRQVPDEVVMWEHEFWRAFEELRKLRNAGHIDDLDFRILDMLEKWA